MLSRLGGQGGTDGGSRTAGNVPEIVEGPRQDGAWSFGGAPVEIGREEGVGVLLAGDGLVSGLTSG
jgi:hypothetical protein